MAPRPTLFWPLSAPASPEPGPPISGRRADAVGYLMPSGDVYTGEARLEEFSWLEWPWWLGARVRRVVPEGRGTLVGRRGGSASGVFCGGALDGPCRLRLPSGARLEGTVRQGRWAGEVRLDFAGGGSYLGGLEGACRPATFLAGSILAGGVMTRPDGSTEAGSFARSGERAEDGGERAEIWRLCGLGARFLPDGSHLEGTFEAGELHGFGSEITPFWTYTGAFARGRKEGYGEIVLGAADILCGIFEGDQLRPRPRLTDTAAPGGATALEWLSLERAVDGQRWAEAADFFAVSGDGCAEQRWRQPARADARGAAEAWPFLRRLRPSEPIAAQNVAGLMAWRPQVASLVAVAEILRSVPLLGRPEHADTRRFLLSVAHLLGPARPFWMTTPAQDYELAQKVPKGHFATMLDFAAAVMPERHQVKLAFGPDAVAAEAAYILYHGEHHRRPRRRLKSLMEAFGGGLGLVWGADRAAGNADHAVCGAAIERLQNNGPCLEGRMSALSDVLVDFGLVRDAARAVADEPSSSSPQARVLAELAAFRARALGRARAAVPELAHLSDGQLAETDIVAEQYFTLESFREHMEASSFVARFSADQLAEELRALSHLAIF